MKTCPMCGTLLFDDVEKCTKCGVVLSQTDAGGSPTEVPPADGEPSPTSAPEPTPTSPESAPEVMEEGPPQADEETTTPMPVEGPGEEAPPPEEALEGTQQPEGTTSEEEGEPGPDSEKEVMPEPEQPSSVPEENVESEGGEKSENSVEKSDDGEVVESAQKRKKWLNEQEKIKSELANIMSRVGKKKRPAMPYPPQYYPVPGQQIPPQGYPQQPAPQYQQQQMPGEMQQQPTVPQNPGPEQSENAQAPTNIQPQVQNNNPQPSNVEPPTVQQQQQQQPQVQVQVQVEPQIQTQTEAQVEVEAPVQSPPQAQPTPQQPTAPPATELQPGESAEGGLSEFDKKELLGELDDLRNEGYNVTRLEKIIEEDPSNAWKSFSEFLDDVEKVNKQRRRIEKIKTEGFDNLETKRLDILSRLNDPDKLPQIEIEITELENDLLSAKSEKEKAASAVPPEPTIEERVNKYIAAGKDAVRQKNYERALKIFNRAYEVDPNNREILFFKRKLDAKLTETTVAPPPSTGMPGDASEQQEEAMAQGVGDDLSPDGQPPMGPDAGGNNNVPPSGKKKKKKKKKIISRAAPDSDQEPSPRFEQAPGDAPTNNGDVEGPKTAVEFEALGFNAYINKDYPKALEFFEKVLQIDANFPNVENLKNECLMRLGKN